MLNSSLQLKGNIYHVAISYKNENGENKVKWVSTKLKKGTDKRLCKKKQKEIVTAFEEELNRKKYAPKLPLAPVIKYPFVDFMEKWLELNKKSIAPTTYNGYAKNVRKIKEYFGKDVMLDELTRIQIKDFYFSMRNEGLSSNTIKRVHANIHKALDEAVERELIKSNPSEKISIPKGETYNATFYNKEELQNLFKVFKGDRMELVVHIAAYYGLRRSEVAGLKWDAVDFKNKTITIQHKITNSYGSGGEEIIESDTLKTISSRRTLPLLPHIEEMLLKERQQQEYYKKLLRDGYCNKYDGYICRDNLGELITPGYITDHFRHIVEKNELRKLRFHDLRHSCASLLAANGVSMKEIQEWLGHSNFNITANLYSHLEYKAKIASANIISAALG